MEDYKNDYKKKFLSIEKMIESVTDLNSIVGVCLGEITVRKKTTYWIIYVITFLVILRSGVSESFVMTLSSIVLVLFFLREVGRSILMRKILKTEPMVITKTHIYIFDKVIYDKRVKTYSYKNLIKIDRNGVENYVEIDDKLGWVEWILVPVSMIKQVVGGFMMQKTFSSVLKYKSQLKLKTKDRIIKMRPQVRKSFLIGYEGLIASDKHFSLDETALYFFNPYQNNIKTDETREPSETLECSSCIYTCELEKFSNDVLFCPDCGSRLIIESE